MNESTDSNNKAQKFFDAWRLTKADSWSSQAIFWPLVFVGAMIVFIKYLHDGGIVSRDIAIGLSAITAAGACICIYRLCLLYWRKLDEMEQKIEGFSHFTWGSVSMMGVMIGMFAQDIYDIRVEADWVFIGMALAYLPIRALVRWRMEG